MSSHYFFQANHTDDEEVAGEETVDEVCVTVTADNFLCLILAFRINLLLFQCLHIVPYCR